MTDDHPTADGTTADSTTADGTTADGTIEKGLDGSTTIRFDRRLRHPIERVWQALTDPDELRGWWGETKLDPVAGGLFQLRWRNTDEHGNVATLDGAIARIDPPRLLEISAAWGTTDPNQPGTRTHLTWRLEPDGDHTLLHFTNTVDPSAPDIPTAAGWHLHLDALAATLSGADVDIAHPEPAFAPLQKAYTEKYGTPTDGSAEAG
jgi:uncharacterized protein YndB with AHSA1/START domain